MAYIYNPIYLKKSEKNTQNQYLRFIMNCTAIEGIERGGGGGVGKKILYLIHMIKKNLKRATSFKLIL